MKPTRVDRYESATRQLRCGFGHNALRVKRRCAAGVIALVIFAGWGPVSSLAAGYSLAVGDILVANYDKGSVVKIDGATGTQERLGGTFSVPTDLVLDPAGRLYVSEWMGAVKRLDLIDGSVSTVIPAGSGPSQIWGITRDATGDLFVTSRADHGVYRVDAVRGTATLISRGLIFTPVGIDLLDSNHLGVACLLTNRVVAISLADNSQTVVMEGKGLDQPWGVAVNGNDLYVTGFDRKELQRVSGGTVSTIAIMADFPYGLGLDLAGNLVVGLKGVGGTVVSVNPEGNLLKTYSGPLVGQVTGVEVSRISVSPNTNMDSDGDGMTDGEEAVAGTDPQDAASVLRVAVSASSTLDAETVLEWSSVSGRLYSVLGADTPLGSFTVLTNTLIATPPVNSWTQAVAGAAHRFYRIGVQRL